MATNDVPGAKASNRDSLYPSCWAEHKDGSLIWIYEADDKQVVYSMFDMSKTPPIEYRDAMPRKGFDKDFSGGKWVWHDKHPEDFPWDKIMEAYPAGVRDTSAQITLTAAARIAKKMRLSGDPVSTDLVVPSKAKNRVLKAIEKLQKAVEQLPI